MYCLHSASCQGLKWVSFMGHFLALVTRTGQFRLVVPNFDFIDDHLLLLEYQFDNGEAITAVKLFPEDESVMVAKGKNYTVIRSEE